VDSLIIDCYRWHNVVRLQKILKRKDLQCRKNTCQNYRMYQVAIDEDSRFETVVECSQ